MNLPAARLQGGQGGKKLSRWDPEAAGSGYARCPMSGPSTTGVPDALLGRVIGGDFEVIRAIATGGMGAVYEAHQRSTGKSRALKVMHAWLLSDERMRGRFVDEARTAGSLESDHVVEVVSAGIDEDLGVPWIAMELLRGRTLAAHLEQLGRPLTLDECLEVLSQLRDGLQLAHDRGLVHRDLKPDNVFVAAARRRGIPFTIKILDFGIAKWVREVRDGQKNSQAMGTPSWMSPEQLSPGDAITPRADVWALGLMAFWMLTQKEYWIAANDEQSSVSSVLLELVHLPVEPASRRARRLGATAPLPDGFDAWFERCVHRDPELRPADAASAMDALRRVLEGGTPIASAPDIDLSALLAGEGPDQDDLRRAIAESEDGANDDRAWWVAHSLAFLGGAPRPDLGRWLAKRTRPRPTARPLGPDGLDLLLVSGIGAIRPLAQLCEMLAEPLLLAGSRTHPPPGADVTPSRAVPDRVRDAVRHAALILGVRREVTLVAIEGDAPGLQVLSIAPTVLGASATVRAETSVLALRAHAGVALTRGHLGLGLVGALTSPADLEEVRKAAHALTRGTISSSRHYRARVTRLGPRRADLARLLDAAQPVPASTWWSAAELAIARAALLTSADLPSTLSALAALVPGAPTADTKHALSRWMLGPTFADFWHA